MEYRHSKMKQVMEEIRTVFGIDFVRIETESVESELWVQPEHLNFMGIVYGGYLFNLADLTAGIAFISDGAVGTTVSGNMKYLRAAKDTKKIVCNAVIMKRGSKLDFIYVEIKGEDGKMIATGDFIFCREKTKNGDT